MIIGDRLRELREAKGLKQSDIQERTGLLRCYVSRIEHGHTVPAVATLEKFARALEVPLYQMFYEGSEPVAHPLFMQIDEKSDNDLYGRTRREAVFLNKILRVLARNDSRSRKFILSFAGQLARRNK
jgi:transcriptional regulator with XRE-family HTH domain